MEEINIKKNPFKPGSWVYKENFYGRNKLINEILDIDCNQNAIWILGNRRSGKTSLLKQIEYLSEMRPYSSGFISLYWDLEGCRNINGLNNVLFDSILDAKERFISISIDCDELEKIELFEKLNILKRKAKQVGRKFLLLIDETEELFEIQKNNPEVIPRLRNFLQQKEYVRSIISGTKQLSNLVEIENSKTSPFLHGFDREFLSSLEDEAAKKLIQQGNFDEHLVKEIMDLTDNHPYLVQLICHSLFENCDLENAKKDVTNQISLAGIFKEDYQHLSETEQQIIKQSCQEYCHSLIRLSQLINISVEEMDKLLYSLLRLRYIKQKNNHFSIGNYFFKEWVKSNYPVEIEPTPSPINTEAEKINDHLSFFEEMKQKGRLDEFSHNGFIAVHEFKNEQGKIVQTELGRLLGELKNASEADCTVLITGETGAGKQLIAELIHEWSNRSKCPMVPLDCAAIPDNLVESEFFGHEKGAFTGAITEKAGMFEVANGGTIFLDEIGDLKYESQAKLLRVIEEKKCKRIGATKEIEVDVRIIAATNKDLKDAIEKKDFREDLYARLQVWEIKIIPLRDRKIDIPFLIDHFRKEFNQRYKKQKSVSIQAIIAAMCYDWPKNVRELRNFVERLILKSTSNEINLNDVLNELEIQPVYRSYIENLGMQQIESKIFSEKKMMVDLIKSTIENNKIDDFLQSNHLKLHQKSYTNCYKYFKAFVEDNASTLLESQRIELFNKIIIQMWEELCEWYKKEKKGNLVNELYPKLNKILCNRKTILNLKKRINSIKA